MWWMNVFVKFFWKLSLLVGYDVRKLEVWVILWIYDESEWGIGIFDIKCWIFVFGSGSVSVSVGGSSGIVWEGKFGIWVGGVVLEFFVNVRIVYNIYRWGVGWGWYWKGNVLLCKNKFKVGV